MEEYHVPEAAEFLNKNICLPTEKIDDSCSYFFDPVCTIDKDRKMRLIEVSLVRKPIEKNNLIKEAPSSRQASSFYALIFTYNGRKNYRTNNTCFV